MKRSRRENKDLVGQVFERLTVIEYIGRNNLGKNVWKCLCQCGTYKNIVQGSLITGLTRSCGCLYKETRQGRRVHGKCGTSIYIIYNNMIRRCYNIKDNHYHNYGGRGIKVCDRWLESFQNFYDDMGDPPSKDHSLDRIDNDGDYCPENCRWADNITQANNKTDTKYVDYEGERVPLSILCRKKNVPYKLIYDRLRWGWDLDKALNTPVRKIRNRNEKSSS